MELTNQQFMNLTVDAKASMIYALLERVERMEMNASILRREVKNLREKHKAMDLELKKRKRREARSESKAI
jgi:hypothetical protein